MANNYIKLDKFNRIKIDIGYEAVAERIAKDCAEEIKENARTHPSWKHYGQDWSVKRIKDRQTKQYYYRVYSINDWQLTFLLENGHLIVNKNGGTGWSAPRVHIAPAREKNFARYEEEMKKASIDVSLE